MTMRCIVKKIYAICMFIVVVQCGPDHSTMWTDKPHKADTLFEYIIVCFLFTECLVKN